MKRFNFLSMAVIAVLMVVAVSCTTVQTASEGEYDRDELSRTRRVVLVDPNYGFNTMLVRDAATGRYYEIETNRYGGYYSPYNTFYDRYYYDRRYYNNRYYSQPRNNTPQRSPEQRAEDQRRLEDAKKRILGN
jgi:hypothetical protein